MGQKREAFLPLVFVCESARQPLVYNGHSTKKPPGLGVIWLGGKSTLSYAKTSSNSISSLYFFHNMDKIQG